MDEAGFELSNVNRKYGHAASGVRVRKPGNYSRDTNITVILAIEPGDPTLPANTRGSIQCPRRWYRILQKKSVTAFEFADFISYMLSNIVTNPVPLQQQPSRTIMFDNLSSHLAPITIQAIDGHPSGLFDHVPRPPYRPYEGPIEYVFCVLADALNRRCHQIMTTDDLFVAITRIIPNLSHFDNTFIKCGYQ